jgi:hypothetical protein
MVVGVVEVVDGLVVVEGRGMVVVVVDIGNGDGGKQLCLDLLIFRLFAGYKHSAGVSAFVSTIFQYITDDLGNCVFELNDCIDFYGQVDHIGFVMGGLHTRLLSA